MEVSQQHVIAFLLGAGFVWVIFMLFRRNDTVRARSGRHGGAVDLQLELARTREHMQNLETRCQGQVEFFVNFPEVVKTLTAALSREQVTAACSRGVSALLHTHSVGIFLQDPTGRLVLVDGAGWPSELRNRLTVTQEEIGAEELLQHRTVSLLESYPEAGAALRKRQIPAEVAVPIWYGDRMYGLITVAEADGGNEFVRRVLAMIADLSGVGLHAASQVTQIRQEAECDALTGLANRRTLFRLMNAELDRGRSYGASLSVAMIDVDHFKKYNDQNGHQAGDDVLRMVAKLIRSTTRRTDVVARYGGEEFTVLLVGADRQRAVLHADRIREKIATAQFQHGEKQPLGRVSISVGVATFPDDAVEVDYLVKAADQALYHAKESGRNRVVQYAGARLVRAAEAIAESKRVPCASGASAAVEVDIDTEGSMEETVDIAEVEDAQDEPQPIVSKPVHPGSNDGIPKIEMSLD